MNHFSLEWTVGKHKIKKQVINCGHILLLSRAKNLIDSLFLRPQDRVLGLSLKIV